MISIMLQETPYSRLIDAVWRVRVTPKQAAMLDAELLVSVARTAQIHQSMHWELNWQRFERMEQMVRDGYAVRSGGGYRYTTVNGAPQKAVTQ